MIDKSARVPSASGEEFDSYNQQSLLILEAIQLRFELCAMEG